VNERQRTFARLLFEGHKATEAYKLAGYKGEPHSIDSCASRLAKNVDIMQHLASLQGKLDAASVKAVVGFKVTKQWVIDKLVDNVNRAMQIVPVLNAEGEETGVFTWQGHIANKALELLGTELGMFVERSEADQTIRIITDKPLDAEQWGARYAKLPPLKLVKPVDRDG
jgi:phage terminase small subunit